MLSAALFGAGILLTAYLALGLTPGILVALTGEGGRGHGYADSAFGWGVAVYFLGSLVHRLRTAGPTLPSLHTGLPDFFNALARGWGLGVAILGARVIGDALRHFGEPPLNGSYIADAFFFALVLLIASTPGLLAALLSKWLR